MGNFSALVGCPSKKAAMTQNYWSRYWDEDFQNFEGWGPVWTSKYCIAGFWLACFSPEDKIIVSHSDEHGSLEFTGFFTTSDVAIKRLRRRKNAINSLIPKGLKEHYAKLYDEWANIVERDFKSGILLDCDDLFGMCGHDEGSIMLEEHVQLISKSDDDLSHIGVVEFGLTGLISLGEISPYEATSSTPERSADGWRFSATGDPNTETADWPPSPSEHEIEFAKRVHLEMQEAEQSKPKTNSESNKPWWKIW